MTGKTQSLTLSILAFLRAFSAVFAPGPSGHHIAVGGKAW